MAMTPEYFEYPRMLYKAGCEPLTVQNDAGKIQALKDGWSLKPVSDTKDAPLPPNADARPTGPGEAQITGIGDLNPTDAVTVVNTADLETLGKLEAVEKAHPRHPGGRKPVLDAIAARLTALRG